MIEELLQVILFQFIISFPLIWLSKKLHLVDSPLNKRKIHKYPIPYVGGFILSNVFLFTVFVTDFNNKYLNLILTFSFLACILGLLDDRFDLEPQNKIFLQTIPIFFLIEQGLFINNLGTYQIIGEIELGSFGKIFTLLACLLLINSFNYCDGLDGLLGSNTLIVVISFIFLSYIQNNFEDVKFLFLVLISICIFLLFNLNSFKSFKIFLGDSGSNSLGFFIGFSAIYLSQEKNIEPSLIIWPLAFFVYEFISVNILRAKKKQKILLAGRDHLHYILYFKFKFSLLLTVLFILLINIFLILCGFLTNFLFSPTISILMFILLFAIYFVIRKELHLLDYENK